MAHASPPAGSPAPFVDVPRTLHVAGWGRRLVAFFLDLLVVSLAQAFIALPWLSLAAATGDTGPFGLMWGAGSLVSFLYFWLLTSFNEGRTLGKMALGLETVSELGGRPSPGQGAIDAVGKAFFLPIDVLVGLFIGRDRRQRMTQKLAGVVVVRREPDVDRAGSVRFVKA